MLLHVPCPSSAPLDLSATLNLAHPSTLSHLTNDTPGTCREAVSRELEAEEV